MATVLSGLDVLRRQRFRALLGKRVGLVTHPAAVDSDYRSCADVIAAAGVRLVSLFGPEHGFHGQEQDLVGVREAKEITAGVRRYSLYGDSTASLKPTAEHLADVDVLVIDLQDVGSRYYTFQATMLLCLETASEHGVSVIVLDRPNPLAGVAIEGPLLQPGFESFVGLHPVAIRHGMTIGELARLYHAERNLSCPLEVVPCEGWRRSMSFDQTGLPWVMPSPNMPALETAFVYPGQCLIEGTNLSEGRGTTRPFEICGAPWVDPDRLAEKVHSYGLPGVVFRPLWFRPTFQKFAGQSCGGVQLHVVDRNAFRPVRTSLALLAAFREVSNGRFDWRRETYEFVSDRLAIDLLFGSSREREALEAGASSTEIARAWAADEESFRRRREKHLLYVG